jgi:PIN domain nuclease of toxin-antitoxin system
MLLDTCTLLWLAQGASQLSSEVRERIDAAPSVSISAITGFEIGIKSRAGKLVLPALPAEWLEIVLDHHGIAVIPLDLRICVTATQLPMVHRDPCDRLIIATARVYGSPVVTADPRFGSYGVPVIW